MKKRPATIHDIAKLLNITASTVSRALNNHPRISDKTKKKVIEAAKKLNYKPNTIASNLRKGRGNTIGIIIPVINRYFFANIIHGIESIMNPAGYNLIICPSHESLENEIKNIQTLINNRVSGILVSISKETRNLSHFDGIFKSETPLVLFDRVLEGINVHYVNNDDFRGAYDSVSHLIEKGYKQIVHFAGPQYIVAYQMRLAGYKRALEDHGISFKESLVYEGVITREMGSDTLQSILDKGKPLVDAVFAASDMSALGALLLLRKRGIKVPREFGVSGYVNEPFGEYLDPSLTTTEQFGEEIGITAAKLLLSQIESSKGIELQQIAVTPKLIVRNSTNR